MNLQLLSNSKLEERNFRLTQVGENCCVEVAITHAWNTSLAIELS